MPRIEGIKTGVDRYGKSLYAPIVTVTIRAGSLHQGGPALIDSGAAHTIFPAELAKLIGINYDELDARLEESGEGAGGGFLMRPAHAVVEWRKWQVCDALYVAEPGRPSPLLGRVGFFDRFAVQFNWHLSPPELWITPPEGEDPLQLVEPPDTISEL